jgi:hypothetical protein
MNLIKIEIRTKKIFSYFRKPQKIEIKTFLLLSYFKNFGKLYLQGEIKYESRKVR